MPVLMGRRAKPESALKLTFMLSTVTTELPVTNLKNLLDSSHRCTVVNSQNVFFIWIVEIWLRYLTQDLFRTGSHSSKHLVELLDACQKGQSSSGILSFMLDMAGKGCDLNRCFAKLANSFPKLRGVGMSLQPNRDNMLITFHFMYELNESSASATVFRSTGVKNSEMTALESPVKL